MENVGAFDAKPITTILHTNIKQLSLSRDIMKLFKRERAKAILVFANNNRGYQMMVLNHGAMGTSN